MKIAVIGSGGWGTAIAILLSSRGHNVYLWSWIQEGFLALRLRL